MDVRATGKTKVFRNSRQGRDGSTFFTYNASLSKKNQDGSYDHANLEVRFRRGMEPTAFVYTGNGESIDIDIKDGFLTFRKYQTQDGQSRSALYIMVMDYEVLGQQAGYETQYRQPQQRNDPGVPAGFESIDDQDIPF